MPKRNNAKTEDAETEDAETEDAETEDAETEGAETEEFQNGGIEQWIAENSEMKEDIKKQWASKNKMERNR